MRNMRNREKFIENWSTTTRTFLIIFLKRPCLFQSYQTHLITGGQKFSEEEEERGREKEKMRGGREEEESGREKKTNQENGDRETTKRRGKAAGISETERGRG